MARPILINYQECAFTIPWSSNRQEVHDGVYNVLLEGKHVPESQTTRAFVFDVTRMGESALITARAPEFKGDLPSEPDSMTVREGDRLKVEVRLSALRRQSVQKANGKRKVLHKAVSQQDVPDWASALLERHGMTPEQVICTSYRPLRVLKKDKPFMINEASIEAIVTVDTADRFMEAFLGGLGRHKGYGLGKMEVAAA